jgi:uncharacterized protein (TIGR03435 family)
MVGLTGCALSDLCIYGGSVCKGWKRVRSSIFLTLKVGARLRANMTRSARVAAVALLCGFGSVWAQRAPARVSFEVASVRANPSENQVSSNVPIGPGDNYSKTGGRLSARDLPLINYILFAYKVTGDQPASVESQLPGWVMTERFDIEAKTDGDPAKDTKDQMRLIMQSLLTERFKLNARYETKEVPMFSLTLAKPDKMGPQLRQHPEGAACPALVPATDDRSLTTTLDGGYPARCGGFHVIQPSVPGRLRVGARDVTMDFIGKNLLSNFLNRPVIDRTGMSGTFDVVMEFVPEQNGVPKPDSQALDTGPTFLEALSEQVGLKAESTKGPADVLVISHIEHPSEN